MQQRTPRLHDTLRRCCNGAAGALVAAALSLGLGAHAASTDISNTPLANTADITAKPNVMFILDSSGSMSWSFMPDDLGKDFSNYSANATDANASARFGWRSSHCNGVAFNPEFKYEENLPLKPDGTPYPHASFSAAPADGFQVSLSGGRNLVSPITIGTGDISFKLTNTNGSFTVGQSVAIVNTSNDTQWMIGKVKSWNNPVVVVTVSDAVGGGSPSSTWAIGTRSNVYNLNNAYYYTYQGTKPDLGWKYTASGLDRTNDGGFANECLTATNTSSATPPESSIFKPVVLTASSTLAQRYADWYAYYSKRYLMMRTVAGRSFQPITDKYRVGFTTINNTSAAPSSTFLEVAPFDASQKADFYTSLYRADPNNGTPLRGALAKVGRYFANKAPGQVHDPMEYACQRNYAILSTDGYWNTGLESTTYGPLKLDGVTKVDQQDGTEVRPMYDGATTTVTTTDTWTVRNTNVKQVVTPKTTTSTSSTTTTTTTTNVYQRTTYALTGTSATAAVSNSNVQRCGATFGSCTVTVTTSTAHNLKANDKVLISGVSPSSYNGLYTVVSASTTQFTYTLASRPSSAPSTYGSSLASPAGCPAGQGLESSQVQRRTDTATTTVTDKAITTTPSTTTDLVTTITTTPWTHKLVVVNGTTNTDTTTAGTPTSSTSTTSDTVSGTSTTSNSSQTSNNSTTGTWASYGTASVGSVCRSTAQPTTAETLVGSNTSVTGPGTPSVTTNTVAGTAATTVVSNEDVKSAVASNTSTASTGGSADSLADIAEYYYMTDLRTSALANCTGALGHDVCSNEVPPAGRDTQSAQHMTTFTLGLGVNGTLAYNPNYLDPTVKSGAYYDMVNGRAGVMWPVPNASREDATHVDDLWHAAVNGRGQYWATSNPGSLADAINTALSSVQEASGSSSSAATSSLKPIPGDDNLVFVATFVTQKWYGGLTAYKLDAEKGTIDLKNPVWSAAELLSARTPSTRTIFYRQPSGGAKRDFSYANLTADGFGGYLNNFCNQSLVPTQCPGMDSEPANQANSGANLVSYLRGDEALTAYEYTVTTNGNTETRTEEVFRNRAFVLGDIISSSPVYLSKPPFHYSDAGYNDFITAKASRRAVVYVGANDGMLHAFAARTEGSIAGGTELWAYVPTAVIPNLYTLADKGYKDRHRFFVDGTPVVGDIKVGDTWKTILVGGLNSGGRAYYALDITDPDNPVPLWEFTHRHLGLSYGNPVIAKRADGKWYVAITSGYNNNTGEGDGNGHLFLLDAATGELKADIPTLIANSAAGSTTTPSGMGRLNAWIDEATNNTAKRFYAGDLLGNVWRFDVDNLVEPNGKALQLAKLQIDGVPQPISARPQLALISNNGSNYPVVLVGTGRYLGISDIADKSVQSVYAIKDPMTATGWGDVRTRSDMVVQTLTDASSVRRNATKNTVDWSQKVGWRIDLPSEGERVAIDMQLQYNTLAVISAIPGTNECKPAGGTSWLYGFDIRSGAAPTGATDGAAGIQLGAFLGVGLTWIELSNGTSRLIIPGSDASMHVETPAQGSAASNSPPHRTSWRELVN